MSNRRLSRNPFQKLSEKLKRKSVEVTKRKNSFQIDIENLEEDEAFTWLLYCTETHAHNLVDPARKILSQYKHFVNKQDPDGKTPLHLACNAGNLEMVKIMIELGGDCNITDKCGWNSLHFAANGAHEVVVDYLLQQEGIQVNVKNSNGNTPLHYLCRKNLSASTLDKLLAKGADINSQSSNGETPLHTCCWGGQEVASLLVVRGANVNLRNQKGETPLHWAARLGRVHMVKLLIQYGADVQARGRDGLPVDVAAPIDGIKKLLSQNSLSHGLPSPVLSSPESPSVLKEKLPDFSRMESHSAVLPDVDSQWLIDRNEIEFVEKLGSGASAKVYKAMYRSEEVAVKVLKHSTHREVDVDAFLKEFKVMSAVRSPYVVYLYGVILDPAICIVMQYFKRGSLFHVLQEKFALNWELFFRFARDTVLCVNCLHYRKPQIVHRDLKSLNLLVDESGNIRIGDFGLSRFTTATFQSTLGKLKGTYAYCAPEIYNGETFSSASDIYSLSIILWELVNRCVNREYKRPFSEFSYIKQDLQIVYQTAKKGLRPTLSPKVPWALATLIKKCWDQDPKQRLDTKDILQALSSIQEQYESNRLEWDNLNTELSQIETPVIFEKIAKSRSSSFGGESPKSEVKNTEQSKSELSNSEQPKNEESKSEQSRNEQSTSEPKSELSGTSGGCMKSEVQQSEQPKMADQLDNNNRPRPTFNTVRPPLPTAPKPPLLNRGSRPIPASVQSPTGATSVPMLPK